MGVFHGKKDDDRGAVSVGDSGARDRGADRADCSRSAGRGVSSEAVRPGTGFDAGRNLPGSQQGLEFAPGEACGSSGVRASNGDSTGASSVHCEEMAASSPSNQENGNLTMNTLAASIQRVVGVNGVKMKTLAATIQKGGQGKTFCVCHLAHAAAEAGLRVLVLDLDPQGNASHTLEEFACEIEGGEFFTDSRSILQYFAARDNVGITLVQKNDELSNIEKLELEDAAGQLRLHVEALSPHFDLCLIDTPPSLSNLMASAVVAADYLISPVELEIYSLKGMELMVSVIHNLRQSYNPGLEFLGMFPNRYNAKLPRHQANLKELRDSYGDLVLPFEVRQRDSIAEALGEYQSPVWCKALRHKSAARIAGKEVRVMTDYVLNAMELVK